MSLDVADFVRAKLTSIDRLPIHYTDTWQIVFACKVATLVKEYHDHVRATKRHEREPHHHHAIDTDGTMSDEQYMCVFEDAYNATVSVLSRVRNDEIMRQVRMALGPFYELFVVAKAEFADVAARILVVTDIEKAFVWW